MRILSELDSGPALIQPGNPAIGTRAQCTTHSTKSTSFELRLRSSVEQSRRRRANESSRHFLLIYSNRSFGCRMPEVSSLFDSARQ